MRRFTLALMGLMILVSLTGCAPLMVYDEGGYHPYQPTYRYDSAAYDWGHYYGPNWYYQARGHRPDRRRINEGYDHHPHHLPVRHIVVRTLTEDRP